MNSTPVYSVIALEKKDEGQRNNEEGIKKKNNEENNEEGKRNEVNGKRVSTNYKEGGKKGYKMK